MNRLDRALGILLLLRSGNGISARALARRFEVSPRTIYRDIEALSALGVPVYAERGRGGGLRLLEGYFLPPVSFSEREALGLLLGVALLGSLRARPFASDLETAARKLVSAVPESLRLVLLNLHRHLGFEMLHGDLFHPATSSEEAAQRSVPLTGATMASGRNADAEGEVVTAFVQGIVQHAKVRFRYHSPYRSAAELITATALGAFWDRGYWYLVGIPEGSGTGKATPRLWRADRVLDSRELNTRQKTTGPSPDFEIANYLGRRWLRDAMQRWADETPVRIGMTHEQAERLQADWYYQYAQFEPAADGRSVMTFGETDEETVLQLVRWLGPGAELLAPAVWREQLRVQLEEMMRAYEDKAARSAP